MTATAGAPLAGIRSPATTGREMRIREIELASVTAPTTSGMLGLTNSTTLGTGTLTSVTGQNVNQASGQPAGVGILITNWNTAVPVVNATYKRRFAFPASIGAAVIWSWPPGEELIIPAAGTATSEAVIVNGLATAPGTWCLTVKWEE